MQFASKNIRTADKSTAKLYQKQLQAQAKMPAQSQAKTPAIEPEIK